MLLEKTSANLYQNYTVDQLSIIFDFVEEIIDNLDELAINELTGGNLSDIDKLFTALIDETKNAVFFRKDLIKTFSYNYLEKFTDSFHRELKKLSLSYFIFSTLPNFEMNYHHLEWGNLTHLYKKLGIIAARDHGKSFYFSFAAPLWKMDSYEPNVFQHGTIKGKRNEVLKEGLLITAEHSLAKTFLQRIREEIETNPLLREKLYPGSQDWGKEEIICKNRARLTVKGIDSAIRGRHPGYVINDDLLHESQLYSQDIREQTIDFFFSVIENMVVPGGQNIIVGCVSGDTLVLDKNNGFTEIINLAPKGIDLENKGIYNNENYILDSFGNFEKSIKYYVNGKVDTKIITLNNNSKLEGSLIHPVWRFDEEGNEDWCKLPELKEGDIIEIKNYEEVEDWGENQEIILEELDYCDKINLPKFISKEIAYFLGLYVAEGNLHPNGKQVKITNQEINLSFLEKYNLSFKNYGSKGFEEGHFFCSRKNFYNWIEGIFGVRCLANSKHIPQIILQEKKENLKEFLSGLFDGDGSAYSNGLVGYSTISPKLAYQIQNILLMGFGIKTSISIVSKETINLNFQKQNKDIKANFDQYIVNFTEYSSKLFYERIGFKLQRKQEKYLLVKNSEFNSILLPTPVGLLRKIKEEAYKLKIYPGIPEQILKREGFLTLKRLTEFYNQFQKCESSNKLLNYISKNWEKVKSISNNSNFTYDFVIPKHNIFISNGIKSHQTPFHEEDLYSRLKKAKGWRVFEYPAINPDGTLLWADRYNFQSLVDKKISQGIIPFTREILCRPISKETSLFPYSLLQKAFVGMEQFTLVENRYSFPIRFKKVVLGADFAISASVGSDYTVFVTLGVDDNNNFWLLNMWRKKGATYNEQLSVIKYLNSNFEYDIILAEDNAFQKVMVQLAQDIGLDNVIGKTTGIEKYDFKVGIPALSVLFERNKFKFPRGNQISKDIVDQICVELSSMSFTDKGLQGVGAHDDITSALWKAVQAAHYVNKDLIVSFI